MSRCPKCQSAMETGFVVDHSDAFIYLARWTEGQPQRSFLGNMKLRGKRQIEITVDRCTRCGFLESYARG